MTRRAAPSIVEEPGVEVPDEPAGGGGRRGAALAWIGWWLASAALWLALVDTTRSHELVAGAVAGMLAAAPALVLSSQRHVVLRPLPVWLLRLWRPLASYPADMWRLSVELVRTTLLRRPPRGQLF